MHNRLVAIACLLTGLSPAFAGPDVDRARLNTDTARRALDDAQRRLRAAQLNEDNLQRDSDKLRDKQNGLDKKLAVLQKLKVELPGKIKDAEALLPRRQEDLTLATANLTKLNSKLPPLQDGESLHAGVFNEIKAKHTRQFEAGEAFMAAKAALDSARARLDRGTATVLATVRARADYKTALAKYTAARATLERIKRGEDVEPSQRAAAASAVIETESAYTRMEVDVLSADTEVGQAKAQVKQTDAAFKALVEQFNRDLPKQPEVAAAQLKLDEARRNVQQCQADIRQTQSDLTAARDDIAATKKSLADMQTQVKTVDGDLAATQKESEQADRDLAATDRKLRDARADVERFNRDVDFAARRHNDARIAEANAIRREQEAEKNKPSPVAPPKKK